MRVAGRLTVALLVGTLAVAILAAPAHATRVTVYGADDRFGTTGEIDVAGGPADNEINLEFHNGFFIVTDKADKVHGCQSAGKHAVRCESPFDSELILDGDRGDDQIRVDRSVRGDAQIAGDRGGDVLIGGRFGDSIDGGVGADVSIGGGGDDEVGLLDASKDDVVSGGAGNDDVNSFDKKSDKRISCGPGRDEAFVDPHHIDPKPVGCEKVKEVS